MALRVGLQGLGRMGRNLFRLLYDHPHIDLVGISESSEPETLEYLLRFDTILGRFPDELSVKEGALYVRGRQVPLLAESRDAEGVDWQKQAPDVVIVTRAENTERSRLDLLLANGASHVVLCAPPVDEPDITVVVGLNDDTLESGHRVISCGSFTANALAPVLRTLVDAFGVERASLTTVHAYTDKLRLADVPSPDPRLGRAAAENIIPQVTDTAALLEGLVPEIEGRLTSKALTVPVPNGSVVDLVCWHRKAVTTTAINEVMRTACSSLWPGILAYEDEPIVSSDVLRTQYSGIFDSLATMTLDDEVSKTLTWFDNGWGYAHRLVELLQRLEGLVDTPAEGEPQQRRAQA